jgi:hypothetical protein
MFLFIRLLEKIVLVIQKNRLDIPEKETSLTFQMRTTGNYLNKRYKYEHVILNSSLQSIISETTNIILIGYQ